LMTSMLGLSSALGSATDDLGHQPAPITSIGWSACAAGRQFGLRISLAALHVAPNFGYSCHRHFLIWGGGTPQRTDVHSVFLSIAQAFSTVTVMSPQMSAPLR
jgi:hypothetical protein